MERRNTNLKIRTHDEVRQLLADISPLVETPYVANGKAGFGTVSANFSNLPDDVDTKLFYGFVTHAPLMVRELLVQLDELMAEKAVR